MVENTIPSCSVTNSSYCSAFIDAESSASRILSSEVCIPFTSSKIPSAPFLAFAQSSSVICLGLTISQHFFPWVFRWASVVVPSNPEISNPIFVDSPTLTSPSSLYTLRESAISQYSLSPDGGSSSPPWISFWAANDKLEKLTLFTTDPGGRSSTLRSVVVMK